MAADNVVFPNIRYRGFYKDALKNATVNLIFSRVDITLEGLQSS